MQNTAYDVRISDWSSDVFSSDLCYCDLFGGIGAFSEILAEPAICPNRVVIGPLVGDIFLLEMPPAANGIHDCVVHVFTRLALQARVSVAPVPRSEEHTSELQSLMRISIAVFCLIKKNHHSLS